MCCLNGKIDFNLAKVGGPLDSDAELHPSHIPLCPSSVPSTPSKARQPRNYRQFGEEAARLSAANGDLPKLKADDMHLRVGLGRRTRLFVADMRVHEVGRFLHSRFRVPYAKLHRSNMPELLGVQPVR